MPDASPYPESVTRLIDEFATLPGIGRRSAERLAYHILASRTEDAMALAKAIRDVKKSIRACSICFHVTEEETCSICRNTRRDRGLLCVVELPRDAIAFEKAGGFNGLYHILQGHISPAEDVGTEELRVRELVRRVQDSQETDTPIREVILATNPTAEGDLTANVMAGMLAPFPVTVTHLARGLASGTELESTAPSSLQFALQGRQPHRVEPGAPATGAGASAAAPSPAASPSSDASAPSSPEPEVLSDGDAGDDLEDAGDIDDG